MQLHHHTRTGSANPSFSPATCRRLRLRLLTAAIAGLGLTATVALAQVLPGQGSRGQGSPGPGSPGGARPVGPVDNAPLPVVPVPPPDPTVLNGVNTQPEAGVGKAEAIDANVAVAQRMSQAAFTAVQGDRNAGSVLAWRQAAAFLEAAHKLNPNEPRYPRLLAEAYSHLGDTDAWATSIERYLTLRGDDDHARLKLIEYYVAKMQTIDAKVGYLTSLLDKPTISNELKSRCATFAAVLLGERSAQAQAEMTAKAVTLDPLNIYARQLEYAQLVHNRAGPEYRLRSLFAQLRCNPSQLHILEAIGREMADAGLLRNAVLDQPDYGSALDWMASAKNLSIYLGRPDPNFLTDYSAQLYIDGLIKEAEEGVGLVLQADPRNLDAWFLLLTLRRAAGLQVALDQDLDRAKAVFAGRAGYVAGQIEAEASTTAAATKPAGPGDVDFSSAFAPSDGVGAGGRDGPAPTAPTGQRLTETIARLKSPDAPGALKAEFISALSDLAWFEVYFNRSASAAGTWIDALAELLPADDVTLVRLRGWFELLENRQAEAMKMLWPIRDRDALAAMGVSRMLGQGNWKASGAATRPDSQDPIKTAQALLNRHPSGLLGAMLMAEFKDRKVKPQPGPQGNAMRQIAKDFPADLLQILVQGERYYTPIGSATKVPYRLGEPMIVDLSLLNRSEHDLPIGPDGIIKPDLWFDARVSLGHEKTFPMAGYDKISGPLVLKARSRTSQLVRVDQGEVYEALQERPAGNVNVYMTVMTNPMVTQQYKVVPGPCGVRQQFSRALIRGGTPIFNDIERTKLLNNLKGLPNEKLWTLEVLTAMVEQSRGADTESNVERSAQLFVEQLQAMRDDRVPEVRAFATYAMLVLSKDPAEKLKLAQALAGSEMWEGRMVAVWSARHLPPAEQSQVLTPLASDPDELVKRAATAGLALAEQAATRPSTQPATDKSPPEVPDGPALPPEQDGPALPMPGQ